jgi:hypothetical protein
VINVIYGGFELKDNQPSLAFSGTESASTMKDKRHPSLSPPATGESRVEIQLATMAKFQPITFYYWLGC